MKTLKSLDRETFKSQFGTKLLCYQYLADQNGQLTFLVLNASIVSTLGESSLVVRGVANVVMMNLLQQKLCFIR
ncbi:MAG: hypothetical protein ACJATI_004263 [Halioglobus sp.]|jgi:hypothetical protein